MAAVLLEWASDVAMSVHTAALHKYPAISGRSRLAASWKPDGCDLALAARPQARTWRTQARGTKCSQGTRRLSVPHIINPPDRSSPDAVDAILRGGNTASTAEPRNVMVRMQLARVAVVARSCDLARARRRGGVDWPSNDN